MQFFQLIIMRLRTSIVLFILMFLTCLSGQNTPHAHEKSLDLAKFNDVNFQIAIDNVYDKLSLSRNIDKGYLYLHRSEEVMVTKDSIVLRFDIGWRDEDPVKVAATLSEKHLFFICGDYAVLANAQSVFPIDYSNIGKFVITDEYLDVLVHEDRELIGLNSAGDTVLYDQSWRPSSVYLHPTMVMEYTIYN